ncbi:MAG TPA: hypothetical protein VJW76_01625 [Verrucomicrobiae bacterium]|nr:hypothetical protein [Verrucomicrobiae bacterium]
MSEPRPEIPTPAEDLNDAKDSLAPAGVFDPVVEVYKKDVDRTILRENLKLSPQERSEKFVSFMKSIWQLREIAEREQRE